MILKKPYAFLIKYFMIIHVILTGAMIYICANFRDCLSFIKEYINNTAPLSIADTYVGIGMYLAIILIIGISFVIFWLMKYKNKPKTLYLFNMILYILLFILTIVLGSTFASLNDQVLSSKTIRMFRDIVTIGIYAQYVFIILMVVRTLGFDVKKFNFASDIQDMNIESADNEEFELTVGVDSNKILRSIRRYFRELKYYYQENKLIILIILGIVIFIPTANLLLKFTVTDKVYNQNSVVVSNFFEMNVTDSYTTKLKYDGVSVNPKDKTYVILKMDIRCLYDDKFMLDTNKFSLEIDKNSYMPVKNYYAYFSDIGYGYDNQKLNFQTAVPYLLVFLVDDNVIDKNKTLVYHEGFKYKNNDYEAVDKKISIKPINLDDSKVISTTNLASKLDFSNTVIGAGSITLKDYEIASIFNEKTSNVVIAGYNKKLLRLGIDTKIDNYSNYEFFNNFVTLNYTKDNTTKVMEFKNKTPKTIKDNLYLEVNQDLETADNIYLEIKIRNNMYKYVIK